MSLIAGLAVASNLLSPNVGDVSLPVGLELSVARSGAMILALKNADEYATNVNLGFTMASGAAHYPTNLSLTILEEGKSRTLPFARGLGAIGERRDDLIIPLLGNCSYVMALNVTDFAHLEDGPVVPYPAKFQAFVTFDSRPLQHIQPDTRGLGNFNLWIGKVDSNIVDVLLAQAR